MDNAIIFADETQADKENNDIVWKILSVDDEPSVHDVTKLVFSNFKFEGHPVSIHCLNSALEAKEYMKNNNDVAVIFLDVVMESATSGFEVVNFVRNELKNSFTRIVMRTGQPGLLNALNSLENYDIDGFSEKTDLTRDRFLSIAYSALRSYRDITAILECKNSLAQLVSSINTINKCQDITSLYKTVSAEAFSLIKYIKSCYLIEVQSSCIKVLNTNEKTLDEQAMTPHLLEVIKEEKTIFTPQYSCSYYKLNENTSLHLYIEVNTPICEKSEMFFQALSDTIFSMHQLLHLKSVLATS